MSPIYGLKFSVSFVFEVETLVKGCIKLRQEFMRHRNGFWHSYFSMQSYISGRSDQNITTHCSVTDKFTAGFLKRKLAYKIFAKKSLASIRLSQLQSLYGLNCISPVQWLLWDRSNVASFPGLNISPRSIVFGSRVLRRAIRIGYVTKINWEWRPGKNRTGRRQIQTKKEDLDVTAVTIPVSGA